MEGMVLLLIALSLAFAVGCWGKTRKIGINILIGIIAVACSKKLENGNKEEE